MTKPTNPVPMLPTLFWMTLLLLASSVVHASPGQVTETLNDVTQGSLMLKTDVPGKYIPAPIQTTDVDIQVKGPLARARVRQRFTNPSDAWAEALYAFPLPQDAAVDRLHMQIGKRVIEGEIREREQARRDYENARRAGKRAALVEQQRPNLFTTAVANIPPHGEIVVEIEYQQKLRWQDDQFSLRFPMAITPRYTPDSGGSVNQKVNVAGGWAVLPGELPNTIDITPPESGDAPDNPQLNPVSLHVTLDSGFMLASLKSRYHPINTKNNGHVYQVQLRDGSVPADRDFELVWQPQAGKTPQAAFFTESTDTGDYGLLMLMPPAQAFGEQKPALRETTYVIDTSGSMGGKSMRAAKRALSRALSRLGSGNTFNVIEFNSQPRALFSAPRPVDLDSRTRAEQFVNGLSARGGTEMLSALKLALAQGRDRPGVLRQIVFITDGAIGNEQQLFTAIHNKLGDARLFTVGIGSAPNSYFMTEAARFGRGSFTTIGDVSEVETKMDKLLRQIEHPALTGLRLSLPVKAETLPNPLPDLYLGEPVSIIMKLDARPDSAVLQGNIGNLAWRSDLVLNAGETQSGLGVLWARSKIADALRELARGADPDKVRSEVLALALKHHLVSPYTSLVAVDKTPARPVGDLLNAHALKNNLPKGWKPVSAQTVPLAQGSTPSLLMLLLGMPLVLLSLAWAWLSGGCRWRA